VLRWGREARGATEECYAHAIWGVGGAVRKGGEGQARAACFVADGIGRRWGVRRWPRGGSGEREGVPPAHTEEGDLGRLPGPARGEHGGAAAPGARRGRVERW
jgi:hypothetical protein